VSSASVIGATRWPVPRASSRPAITVMGKHTETGYVVNSQGMRLQGFAIDPVTGRAAFMTLPQGNGVFVTSALRDLDYASAISEMQSNQTGLEAALRSYSTVGKTSLFQLLP